VHEHEATHETLRLHTVVQTVLLGLFGSFLMYLKVANVLAYYVRPDYQMFTFVMGGVLLVAALINLAILFGQRHQLHVTISPAELSQVFLFVLILTLGVFLPRRSLSAQVAALRGTNQNLLSGSQLKNLTLNDNASPLLHTASTLNYNIADWIRLFSVNPEPDNYVDKKVNVEGFVQSNADGTFTVSRFVVTCCAVDATPIGLIVDRGLNDLKTDDWVHIDGKLEVKEINGQRQVVVEPSDVKKIPQPSEPYLY